MTDVDPIVLTDAFLSIDDNDLSGFATKLAINTEFEDLDSTTFGNTAHRRRGGLEDGTLEISWINDYTATTGLDDIMWPLRGTVVTWAARASSDTVSSSNPQYSGSILINKWSGISGDVGKLSSLDSSFPTDGATARATS